MVAAPSPKNTRLCLQRVPSGKGTLVSPSAVPAPALAGIPRPRAAHAGGLPSRNGICGLAV